MIYLGLGPSHFDTGKGIGHVMVVFPFAQLVENVGWQKVRVGSGKLENMNIHSAFWIIPDRIIEELLKKNRSRFKLSVLTFQYFLLISYS